MNNRAAVRSALKTILSGATDAGSNVFAHRGTSLWTSELPAILIYTNQEQAKREALNRSRYIRTIELTIEVKVEAGDDVAEELDALLGQVEDVVQANESINGTVLSTVQTNTEIRVDSDAAQNIGVGTLTFECQYIS